jgi:heat shock protein HslJ
MKKEQSQNTDINRVHDIWALFSIKGEGYNNNMSQNHPVLELNVSEKRYFGNDGCNTITGSIETLTQTNLKFGAFSGTKMMCRDMKISQEMSALLPCVTSYELNGLFLILRDKKQQELFIFKKVD